MNNSVLLKKEAKIYKLFPYIINAQEGISMHKWACRKCLQFAESSIIIIFVSKKIVNSKPAERQRHKATGPKEIILWLPAANNNKV
jgi:hypothetical protein